jgi:DNA repair exonuclease SbcCD nuclease subunit
MKILHMADIHARDEDIEEVERCLHHIVAIAWQEKPDLIIHAGDTFDSRNVRLDSKAAKLIFQFFSELTRIAPIAVIIGTPTHDGNAAEVLRHVHGKNSIWVSTRPEQIHLLGGYFSKTPWPEPSDAILSMVPAPTKQYFNTDSDIKGSDAEIAQAMGVMFGGFGAQASEQVCPHILVGHWNTTGSLISETQTLTGVDIEVSKDQMALANADLVCLGHIHKAQQLPWTNIFYSGSIYRNNWGELDEKGVYIHDIIFNLNSNPREVKSTFHETPTRKLAKLEYDLTTLDGALDNFNANMVDNLYDYTNETIEGAYLKCEIKVYQDEAAKLDREGIGSFFTTLGAKSVDIKLIRIPRENVRSERILKLTTLREKLIEQARLKGETVSDSILEKADMLEREPGEQIIVKYASL